MGIYDDWEHCICFTKAETQSLSPGTRGGNHETAAAVELSNASADFLPHCYTSLSKPSMSSFTTGRHLGVTAQVTLPPPPKKVVPTNKVHTGNIYHFSISSSQHSSNDQRGFGVSPRSPSFRQSHVQQLRWRKSRKNDLGHIFLVVFMAAGKRHFRHLARTPVGAHCFSPLPAEIGFNRSREHSIPIAIFIRQVKNFVKGLLKS